MMSAQNKNLFSKGILFFLGFLMAAGSGLTVLPLTNFFLPVSLLLVLLIILLPTPRLSGLPAAFWLFVLYVVVHTLILFGIGFIDPEQLYQVPHESLRYYLKYFGFLLLPIAIAKLILADRSLGKLFIRGYSLGFIIISAICYFGGNFLEGRFSGGFTNPNSFAISCLTLLLLNLLLLSAKEQHKGGRTFSCVTIILCAIGIIMAQSRAVFLCLALVSVIALIFNNRSPLKIGRSTILVFISLVSLFYFLPPLGLGGSGLEDRNQIFLRIEENREPRLVIWKHYINGAIPHSLTGVGLGQARILNTVHFKHGEPLVPHSTYIKVFAELGLPGLLLFFGTLLGFAIGFVRHIARSKKADEYVFVGLLVLSAWAGMMFFYDLDTHRDQVALLGIIMVGAYIAGRSNSRGGKTKILLVRRSLKQPGGIELQMLNTAIYLRETGKYELALLTDKADLPLARIFSEKGFETHIVPFDEYNVVSLGWKISRITRSGNFSIIQAYLFRESILCRISRIFNPAPHHVYRVATYIDCSWIPEYKKRLYHFLDKFTSFLVSHYAANGELVKKELVTRAFINPRKITVIYNGAVQAGSTDETVLDAKRKPLEVSMVANFVFGKGHETLIDAVADLARINVPVNVHLFGDALDEEGEKYKSALMRQIKERGVEKQFYFHGFSSNLRSDLTPYPVLVLPSYREGTPNCVLEAMSRRKLVIATPAGETGVMLDHGAAGLLFDAGDREKLANLLQDTALARGHDFEKIRNTAFNRWKQEYSIHAMMNKLMDVYGRL